MGPFELGMIGTSSRRHFNGYLVALSAVAIAALLIRLLQSMGYAGLSPLFAAVVISAWYGGIGPAVFGVVSSTLAAYYLLPKSSGGQLYRQGPADVVYREVLLAQGDDLLAAGVRPARFVGGGAAGGEERALGVPAELVDQAAEAAGRVPETVGGLLGGNPLDEVGAQGLIAAVSRVGGVEEVLGECLFFFFSDKHTSTQSTASMQESVENQYFAKMQ